MSLSSRLIAAMVLLVLLTAGAVAALTYDNIGKAVLPRALDRIDAHARLLALDLEASVRGARADVLGFRSAVAVEGIVRASLAGDSVPPDGITAREWRDRLARRFVAELEAKPSYIQFRIIGVADNGREILRVDRAGPGGTIRVEPDTALQHKADRDYFQRAVALPSGTVDISPVELNQENGAIETPHVPVIRASVSIQTPDGRPFGVLTIIVDLRPAFARIREAPSTGGQRYLVNDRGDYLVHPDPSRAFGFEFGKPVRVQDDYPAIAPMLAADAAAPAVLADRSGDRFGLAVAPVRLAGATRVAMIEAVPQAEMVAASRAVGKSVLMAGLAAALGAAGLAIWLGRSLARPLRQMTRSVAAFGRGENIALPTGGAGEIGVLARAFAAMAARVTERDKDVRRNAELLDKTIASIADAVLVVDAEGRTIFANPACRALFGGDDSYMSADWQRRHHRFRGDGVTPIAVHESPIGRAVAGQSFDNIEVVMRREGERDAVHLVASGRPIRDAQGAQEGAVIVYRDVTQARVTELQLRQAQKLESIGQLTGGVAHDFNNILTVIIGNAELMDDALTRHATDDARDAVQRINDAADRGAELTRRLLAVARRQPLEPRATDINALVREATELLRSSLGEQIEISLQLEPEAGTALIDPSELTTALLNLAVNARDAMPQGGRLTIETGAAVLDEVYAQANAEVRPGAYALVAVSDTGKGIPAAIRDRVFEPFFTTKEPGKGTGLGLSMIYGFIKQSRGHVKIYSEEGHGTTVKLYLPRVEGAAEIASAAVAPAMARGKARILVVEDDDLVRRVAVQQLESLGYTVIMAENGAKALELTQQGAQYDLLLTDVVMPGGLNGRQLAEAVVALRPGVKVLYTSGYTENAIVHHGRLDAGVTLLNKPYRKSDLAQKVRDVLDRPPAAAPAPTPADATFRESS